MSTRVRTSQDTDETQVKKVTTTLPATSSVFGRSPPGTSVGFFMSSKWSRSAPTSISRVPGSTPSTSLPLRLSLSLLLHHYHIFSSFPPTTSTTLPYLLEKETSLPVNLLLGHHPSITPYRLISSSLDDGRLEVRGTGEGTEKTITSFTSIHVFHT